MADCAWRLGEESGANPERSRHCEPPTTRSAEARASPVAGRARRARPVHRRGRGTRRRLAVTCATARTTTTTTGPPRHLPLLGRRRLRRPGPGARPHGRLARGGRRARARREGHREVDDGAWPRRRAAARRQVVAGCRFGCAPGDGAGCPDGPHDVGAEAGTRAARLVELPIGATEDRVVGSLDLERALGRGETAYQPGLLAAANRGILYVDEVNLLHDHLVDLLLDAAAMGRNTVERDGVSVSHAARIVLVGTMNPEEGELRPQLLDRFGLTVEVAAPREPALRAEVVRRRLAFDADPAGFVARFEDDQESLRRRIADARARLGASPGDDVLTRIATVCAGFEVDGLRADIVTARAAVAHAAWSGRDAVTVADVRAAARLALPHRRRRNPFDSPGLDEDLLDQLLGDEDPEPDPDGGPDGGPGDGGEPSAGGPTGPQRGAASRCERVEADAGRPGDRIESPSPASEPSAAGAPAGSCRDLRGERRRGAVPCAPAARQGTRARRPRPAVRRPDEHGSPGRLDDRTGRAGPPARDHPRGSVPSWARVRRTTAAASRRPAALGPPGPRVQPRAALRRRVRLDGRAPSHGGREVGCPVAAARRLPAP